MLTRVLVASALLLSGCSASDAPPEPVRPQTWTVELGTAPTLLAMTDDAVYAASYGNGVGGSQVYRVDRATGRKAAQRTVAGQPHGLALGPNGELWLATLQLPDQPSGTGLQVLDPQTLQTRRALQVEGVPLSVAFVGEQLWVGDGDGLSRLDPQTGQALQRIPTAHPANRLLAGPAGLVVVGPAGLQALDPATGAVRGVIGVAASGSVTATAGADLLWLVYPDAEDRAVLHRHDPTTLEPLAPAPSPGRAGAVAHLAEDVLWVTDPQGGRLLCADPRTGQTRAERPVTATGPLHADAETVVLAQAGGLTGMPARCD